MTIEYRQGARLVIQADLAAIDPDCDVEICISKDVLHIRASQADNGEPGDHASDLRYGNFARDIAPPADTNEAEVTVSYSGAQLEVRCAAHPVGAPAR
jgi:HSP20 family molecular chaperone IbpA